jgi:Uma2 family endonuclease
VTSKVERLMTIVDLEAMPDDDNRYELIEGELFVSPAPGIPHQLVLNRLLFELTLFLRDHPSGRIVPGPGVVLSMYDSVIPDICFVKNERWDEIVANARFEDAPNLVVEILSPGKQNLKRDLVAKRRLYAKYGVEEYWIVDVENRQLIVFQLGDAELVETVKLNADDFLTSQLVPGFRVRVESLFTDLV